VLFRQCRSFSRPQFIIIYITTWYRHKFITIAYAFKKCRYRLKGLWIHMFRPNHLATAAALIW